MPADQLTFLVFYAFDGTHTQDIPQEIEVNITKDMIREYVNLVLGYQKAQHN